MRAASVKAQILRTFHEQLKDRVQNINAQSSSREQKAKEVNTIINGIKSSLLNGILTIPENERGEMALIIQYCFSVASLEYRHRVWPYEYMAFSRRIGELWEDFCSAAWDYPSKADVRRITAPNFNTVRQVLSDRITGNIGDHHNREVLLTDINLLFEIIGDINMKEDEVFTVGEIPYVVDFKSGFGSNEKGNMLRLQTVGRAYRLWNLDTRLLLLVRQEENNNYLEVLRRMGLWSVHTGDAAYQQIAALTGADIQGVRRAVINWSADLSPTCYQYLQNQPTDLTSYLVW